MLTNRSEWRSRRFLRAADYTVRLRGVVRDIATDLPVREAKVTLSGWMPTVVTNTDAQGVFHVIFSRDHRLRTIAVEKPGYDVLRTEARSRDPHFEVLLGLAAPGYRRPNDNFESRAELNGTNVVAQTHTFGATSEAGHELYIMFDDYGLLYSHNLWWSWTAPVNGALLIETDDAPWSNQSGVIVYTGEALAELERVWDTSNAGNAFFVKQGVEYQIVFGTTWPAEAGFNLKMVEPVPPFRIRPMAGIPMFTNSSVRAVGERLLLSVSAHGTSPLSYQWRKDGEDIPGATNTLFFRQEVGLEDAGAYSVLVTNEAGRAVSDRLPITVLPERPERPDVLRGTWVMQTSSGPLLMIFTDKEFSARWAADNSFVGSGHYRFTETEVWYAYRLVITYTEPALQAVRYFQVSLLNPGSGSYPGDRLTWVALGWT